MATDNKPKLVYKNIYYMVAYCIEELKYFDESLIDYENLSGTHDLLAVLLCKSFEYLYRSGCLRQYNKKVVITDKPRGRINLQKSKQKGLYQQGKLQCTITKLHIDTELNQIVKAAFSALINSNKVIEDKIDRKYLTLLNNYRMMLKDVSTVSINEEILNRNHDIPEQYKPVMIISKMILRDWIAYDSYGTHRLLELNDEERLCRIWEKYLRTFIKRNFTDLEVSSPEFDSSLQRKDSNGNQVPIKLHIDIQIEDKKTDTFIIADAKWYNGDKDKVDNRYQINMYCDDCYSKHKGSNIKGILLYASNNKDKTFGGTGGHEIRQNIYEINVNQSKEQLEQDIIDIVKDELSTNQ